MEFTLVGADAEAFYAFYKAALLKCQRNNNSIGLCIQFESDDEDLTDYIVESLALNQLRVVNIGIQSYIDNQALEDME